MTGEVKDKHVNIYELVEHSHVPGFNRILALKLEEIKSGELKADIEAYKEKIKVYKLALLFLRMRLKQGNEDMYPRLYWFELSKFAEGDWGITLLEPCPPPYEPYYEILPTDIYQAITRVPLALDHPVEVDAFPSSWLNKKVDLIYLWSTSNHIVGTVRENISEWEQGLDSGIIPRDAGVEFLYRVLLRVLSRHPGLETEFMRDYAAEMLPKIKKLIGAI